MLPYKSPQQIFQFAVRVNSTFQRAIQLGHVNYPGLLAIADLNPQVAIELSQRFEQTYPETSPPIVAERTIHHHFNRPSSSQLI